MRERFILKRMEYNQQESRENSSQKNTGRSINTARQDISRYCPLNLIYVSHEVQRFHRGSGGGGGGTVIQITNNTPPLTFYPTPEDKLQPTWDGRARDYPSVPPPRPPPTTAALLTLSLSRCIPRVFLLFVV